MSLGNGIVTRGESKFWMGLIALIVSGVIAFTTLKMEVKAMQDKYDTAISETKVDVRAIRKNQTKIMIELGIAPAN